MKKDSLAGISFLLLVMVSLSSCLKNHDDYWNNPDIQNTAIVSVINGAPLSLPLDIQFNGTERWY
ncbi:MAG: DUF4397 domain-containing protein, partial [Niabella sp.]|nr:DUF4397 domain-containing protein [Niabella sp.]